jgi:hypothetical protein
MRFVRDAARSAAARAWLAGLIAFVVAAIAARGRSTPYDNYTLLAQAFAHGAIAIDWPGAYIDALPYAGLHYVIEAPFPAVLLLPWVAIFGSADQTLLSLLLCGVAVGCCWLVCEQLQVARVASVWICAFLLAGTSLWWCAMLGDVWFIAHVASVACTFVALAEVTGKRRGWLVALAAVCAVFSRFALVVAIPVYAWLVLRDRDARSLRNAAIGFALVVAAGAALWVAYNEARWGVWYDIGYTEWYHQDSAGSPVGSPFQLRYLPYQLWSFFVQGPDLRSSWPYLVPSYSGIALTWTSPALLLALFARRPAWTRRRDVDRDGARGRAIVHLLRQRLRAIRNAPRARLRAVRGRADGASGARGRAAARARGDRVVVRGRHVGCVVLEYVLPDLTC